MTERRASVVIAPAGYGKTWTLVNLAKTGLRCLVLTHTNVATSNIKRRLGHAPGVRVETIDAFALRIARAFPQIAGVATDPSERSLDWSRVRAAAGQILQRPALRAAFSESYDLVLVDEYQDCSAAQVELVRALRSMVPTTVLGDPMQSLYDVLESDPLTWQEKIQGWERSETLNTPWRWQYDPDHRDWVVSARTALSEGRPIPVTGKTVQVVAIEEQHGAFLAQTLRSKQGRWAVIMGDTNRPDSFSRIAKSHRWMSLEVAELSQPKELAAFARQWDLGNRLPAVLTMAELCISSTSKVSGFTAAKKNAELRKPTRSKAALTQLTNAIYETGSETAALAALDMVQAHPDTGTYRPTLLDFCKRALRLTAKQNTTDITLTEAVETVLSGARAGVVRTPTGPIVGSVMRLKGLEFDHVVIVNPEDLATKEEVYVAVSRAKTSCTIIQSSKKSLQWFTI